MKQVEQMPLDDVYTFILLSAHKAEATRKYTEIKLAKRRK